MQPSLLSNGALLSRVLSDFRSRFPGKTTHHAAQGMERGRGARQLVASHPWPTTSANALAAPKPTAMCLGAQLVNRPERQGRFSLRPKCCSDHRDLILRPMVLLPIRLWPSLKNEGPIRLRTIRLRPTAQANPTWANDSDKLPPSLLPLPPSFSLLPSSPPHSPPTHSPLFPPTFHLSPHPVTPTVPLPPVEVNVGLQRPFTPSCKVLQLSFDI